MVQYSLRSASCSICRTRSRGDAHALADRLQGHRLAILQAEAQAQDVGFALVDDVEQLGDAVKFLRAEDLVVWSACARVFERVGEHA